MTNYLSIATVTATLGRLIGEALERIPNPSGIPQVRYGPPQADPQHIGCTVFLFRLTPNASRRNEDLPSRDESGVYVHRPRLTLDADYLLTFSGDETTLEAQRFLGAVAVTLHARPFLPAEAVRRTIAGTSFLRGSDFDPAMKVRFVPATLDYHVLSQLWSTFPQVPYNISMMYTASSIPVDADVTPAVPELVQEVDTQVLMHEQTEQRTVK